MAIFTVLSRVDAYVDYFAEVEADTPEEAVDLAYESDLDWRPHGVVEFDARKVICLDDDGEEIDGYSRGKG